MNYQILLALYGFIKRGVTIQMPLFSHIPLTASYDNIFQFIYVKHDLEHDLIFLKM